MTGKQNNLEFQICEWNTYHEIDEENEEKYVIQLFGRTEDDKDVCLKVCGFTPYFYVEVPQSWGLDQVDKFVDGLRNRVSWRSKNNPKTSYDPSKSLLDYVVVNKHKFYGFTNERRYPFLMLIFKSHTAMREFSSALASPISIKNLTDNPTIFQRYEANIEPHIRFMHINNLSSCGWVNIDLDKAIHNKEYSDCDHTYFVDWRNVKPAENDNRIAPLKIMGYDIECISCDENFPQAERADDKIIQIGITMYRYGSMKCYEEHILTLKQCAPMKGVNVECYETEKALLRAFALKIREIRPDVWTGYNNFGFDDNYIYDRVRRIDIARALRKGKRIHELKNKFLDEFMLILGKVNNDYLIQVEGLKTSLTTFNNQKLSSSALGDNILKFFMIPGILSVDMMKVIQRDHKLLGYKLDNVSANFITQKAEKIVEEDDNGDKLNISIYTESTKALDVDSYIQIMVDDSYSASPMCEGAKYHVKAIDTVVETRVNDKTGEEEKFVYQCIRTEINKKDVEELRRVLLDPLLKVSWTFAKDDMHHTTINKHFASGDPDKIAQIAKYCLKDCKLVNLLMAKLEIIVSSSGMAKVCNVPLSYLFRRGQGVKIFSLVSKKCREKNYLIPVLRKKDSDATGDDDDSYEGATVITPKPAVYLSPIAVLDYSSLYPNSMRECNLSQECYVFDKAYDNRPGYIYHDIFIIKKDKKGRILRNLDNSPMKEHHRFCQKVITQEDVDRELAEIYSKIDSDFNNKVNSIKTSKYLSKEFSDVLVNKFTIECDEEIEKIETTPDISSKKMEKMIESVKKKLKLKKESLDVSEKNIKMNDELRKELIDIVTFEANNKKIIEKNSHFNIVDGKIVKYGILPEILTELLNKRKATNKQLAVEKDPFLRAILNSLQLAYKVTANSLYGQTGAPTSPIFFVAIAACTTAIGRKRLHFAKDIVEKNHPGAEVIYGDTDSIFVNFHFKDENGNELTNREARMKTIAAGTKMAKLINSLVPKPQSIVYEKTFHPFILVSKKKYVGLKYMSNPDKYVVASMGIVLKRRDNATIVKIVVGGIIDHILKNHDINAAVDYTISVIEKLMNGLYPIDKFIISKTLRSYYAKPKTIAHKVLADRMAIRDPGNKPQTSDRIPFVYVITKHSIKSKNKTKVLQGDLIEHPDYVIKNNLKIDYLYYLEHQIINPASQILELMISAKQVENIFKKFIINEENKRMGRQTMEKWIDNTRLVSAGSKTKKIDYSVKEKSKNKGPKITFVGKTKRIECQNMNKWLDHDKINKSAQKTRLSPTNNQSSIVKKKVSAKPTSMEKWMKA